MSLNLNKITASIGIPYQQYVTSSAGHTLVSSSTYFNDTSDNIPRYKDASGNIYDAIISSSYALTASHALSAAASTPTLQQVTDQGATTTNDIQITGSLVLSSSFADFSGLTDIKTRKFAITSQLLDPGIKVISASFYDSFIESLDAAVDGDTIHVFANDSSSVVADSFSNKNITILGNGHTFTTNGFLNVHQRYTFTSCSLDIYDYTFFRDNTGHSSYPAASMWQIDKTTLNLYNTEFSASSGYALGVVKDCVINGGKFVSDNTAIYGYSQPNDNVEIRNAEIESDKDGIVLVGDGIKVLNCDVLYHQDSATSSQTKAIVLTGNSCLIQNCNVEGDKEANYGSAVSIGNDTGASISVRNEIQNLSINLGEIYAYGYTDIQGCNIFSEGNYGIRHSGTGSISDCSIEVPGNPNYGYGMYLIGDSLIRVSNVYSKGNNSGVTFSGRKQFFNCVFEGSSATYGSFDGNDVTDLEVSNLTLIAKTGPHTMNVQMSGSGKALINNVTSTIYNEGATGYDGGFLFKGSPDGTATLTNIACYFHSVGGDSGTSTAATISQITSSTIDNFYSEGYKIGLDLRAISSSVSNVHTLLKTDGSYSGNECSLKLLGDQNILTDSIFEIDKAHQDNDPVVKILEGTHNFKNNRFRSAKTTGQYLISGSTNVSASFINNVYEVADASYITASNVTDITTGYIDGRGNWHRSQVTSSFDHIEATSFKGDGSGLTGISASTPTLAEVVTAGASATGDVSITGSLTVSGSSSPIISLPDAPTNAVIVSGSSGTTSINIYDSVDGVRTPTYNIGAGLRLVSGEGAGQSTLDVSAVGSDNGGGSNEQAFIHSNQQLSIRGNASAAGDNIKFLGSHDSYGLKFDASTSGVTLTYFTNGGATVSELNMGNGTFIQADANGTYYRIGRSSTNWLNLSSTKATFVADVSSSSATSTASFGTYIGDGSQLTGISSDPFPYTGDAIITGSLTVSGSFVPHGTGATNGVIIGSSANSPSGNHNVVIGNSAGNSSATGGNTIIGANATSANNSNFTVAIGQYANATGTNAVSIGYSSQAGGNGVALGEDTTAGSNAIAIGKDIVANNSQLAIGYVNPTISASLSTGHVILSGSTGGLELIGSGSTLFEVIGSEGTLFSVDDDLDGTIFTANDRSGLPVLEASASGEVYIGKSPQSLYTTAVISSTTAATTQSIFGLSTSSYGGTFFDYTVQSGSNARAGSIMSVWNGSSLNFTETTTTDIGDTTDFNVIVHISQSQAQIASHASRAGYNIKTIIRSI